MYQERAQIRQNSCCGETVLEAQKGEKGFCPVGL